MVISSTTTKSTYSGNGSSTGPYAIGMPYYAQSDVIVTVGGVVKTLTTDYTISNGSVVDGYYNGGNITFVTAPASGSSNIVITRSVSKVQTLDFSTLNSFDPNAIEPVLDRTALMVQDAVQVSADTQTASVAAATTAGATAGAAAASSYATNAATSATAAATSATASATSATASATSATASATSATNSATSATASATSATASAASATASATSATNAEAQKNAIIGTLSGAVFAPQAQTISFAATNGKFHVVDTSGGAVTATLASSPVVTQMPYWFFPATEWNTNALTIAPNGAKIKGITGSRTIRGKRSFYMFYVSASYGYEVVFADTGVSSGNTFLLASTSPSPFLLIPRALPNSKGLSSLTSSGSFAQSAVAQDYVNFTIGVGHTMTLSPGTTVIRCSGTFTNNGAIAGTLGVTGTTTGDGYTRETGANGADGTAGVTNGAAATSGANATGKSSLGGKSASGAGGGGSTGGTAGVGAVSSSRHGAGGGGGAGYDSGTSTLRNGEAGNSNGSGGRGGGSVYTGNFAGVAGSKGADGSDATNNQCTLVIICDTIAGNGTHNLNGGTGTNGANGTAATISPGDGSNNGYAGAGGGGGGYGGHGGDAGNLLILARESTVSGGSYACSGGVGGGGGNGGAGYNGSTGNGGAVNGGGGAGGSGGMAGKGGKPGLIWIEYETGSFAATTTVTAGAPGTSGTAGSSIGNAGASSVAGNCTAGAAITTITSPTTLTTAVFE